MASAAVRKLWQFVKGGINELGYFNAGVKKGNGQVEKAGRGSRA